MSIIKLKIFIGSGYGIEESPQFISKVVRLVFTDSVKNYKKGDST